MIIWKPQAVQEKALVSNAFEILFGGARGGGKTETGIIWLLKVLPYAGARVLIIRKNYDDLKDWIARASKLYVPMGAVLKGNPAEFHWPNNVTFITGHLKDENAYLKYQGHEYQRMLIEELTQIPDVDRYLMLISSCRSTIAGLDARVFCTTNPGGPGHHWVKERFIDNAEPFQKVVDKVTERTRVFIPAKVSDNPKLMAADPDYIKFLDGLPEQLRKAWRDGDWNSFIGQFLPEFEPTKHVYTPSEVKILRGWPKFRSIDWGYSSPLACYWHAVGPETICTYREYYVTKKLDHEAASEIAALSQGEVIDYTVGDPSSFPVDVPVFKYGKTMPVKRFEVWREHGVPIIMGNNDRLNGWSRMREFLSINGNGQPKWRISNQCVNLIRELSSAVYDKKKVEDIDGVCSDHALDSVRYGLMQQPRQEPPKKIYNSEFAAARAWHNEQKKIRALR